MDGNVILRDLRLATMISEGDDPFGLIEDAVVAITDGRVAYAGPATHFAAKKHDVQSISMDGRLVLPGFVCCHNTLLWAQGATANPQQDARSYRRLINETAELTATTSDAELLDCARDRLAMLMRSGVTTFELKSGFGRTPEEELRLAQLIRQLQGGTSALSTATLYAGHFIPEDTDPGDHLEAIVTRLLPQIQESQGCDAVQVFCDEAAGLDLDQASTILEAFYRKKTPSRVACDRFADSAGATLPASFYSRSATYLCQSDETGLGSIAGTGTTMVLVPEIALSDLDSRRPDIAAIRACGGHLAVSSESGPDGAGKLNLLTAARLAVDCFQLTPYEALSGITLHAARALGLAEQVGSVAVGKRGDLVVFDAETPEDLVRGPDMLPFAVIAAGASALPT